MRISRAFPAAFSLNIFLRRPSSNVERHHQFFPKGVDRRIRDLREPLRKEIVQQLGPLGQHGQRRVVSHGSHRFLAVVRHGYKHIFDFVRGIPECQLPPGKVRLFANRHGLDLGVRPFEIDHVVPHPSPVGPAAGKTGLDLVVLQQHAPPRVHRDHLSRSQAPFLHDVAVVHLEHPDLRTHNDQAAVRDLVPCGPQPVPVQRGAHDGAVAERDSGGPVPGFHQTIVIFIESAKILGHVRDSAMGLRNQHHHRVHRIPSGHHQRFEDIVEHRGIAAGRVYNGFDPIQIPSPTSGLELRLARLHPVHITPQGVDFAVVGQISERLRQKPVGQRIGAVALVKDGQRGFEVGILQVPVKPRKLRGHHHPFIDDRSVGQRTNVAAFDSVPPYGSLHLPSNQVQRPFELRFGHPVSAGDKHLLNIGHQLRGPVAEDRPVHGHRPPTDQHKPVMVRRFVDDNPIPVVRCRVLRQEQHADRQVLRTGRSVSEPFRLTYDQPPGDLGEYPRPVTGFRIGIHRAPMSQIGQSEHRMPHDITIAIAPDIRNEPHPARVVLEFRAVEPVC